MSCCEASAVSGQCLGVGQVAHALECLTGINDSLCQARARASVALQAGVCFDPASIQARNK